jgi:argininosuccinate synthase
LLPHPLAAAPQDAVSQASLSDDKSAYNQKDAEGFIRLNALRLRIGAKRDLKK